jgi:hypothetical protein
MCASGRLRIPAASSNMVDKIPRLTEMYETKTFGPQLMEN